MPTKDAELEKLIDRIGEHYRGNIYSPFLRDSLRRLQLSSGDWDKINCLVEVPEYIRLQGYPLLELYEQILAMARFVKKARIEVLPGVAAAVGGSQRNDPQSVLRNMAMKNLGSNLRVLADLLNEVYVSAVEIDRQANPKGRKDYERLPELGEMGNLLVDR